MYLLKRIEVDISGEIKCKNGLDLMLYNLTNVRCLNSRLFGSLKVEVKINMNNSAKLNKIKGSQIYQATYTNSYELKSKKDGVKEISFFIREKEYKIDGYILFIDCFYVAKTSGTIIAEKSFNGMVVVLKEGEEIEITTLENENEVKKNIKVIDNQLYLSI